MRKIANKLLIALTLISCTNLKTNALQIVYPKAINTEISATSTFIIGNTLPNSSLTINNEKVKVYENGSFVQVVPLSDGENTINIESTNNEKKDKITYIIKKVEPIIEENINAELQEFEPNQFLYATAIKNQVPLRTEPNENAKRYTHLDANTILMVNGQKGDYFRVSLSPTQNVWVKANNIVKYSIINGKMLAVASQVTTYEDKLYTYIKTDLPFQIPYKITESDNGLILDLYNIKKNEADTKIFQPIGNIKNLAINTVTQDYSSTYFIELQGQLWGYDAYYKDNSLIIKIRKPPQIAEENPLKNITIAIDAGHGGEDAGAIGPTGIKEKDINLDIAKKLENILKENGAKVILTRENDENVALYTRPLKAKEENALILLSLHANALPDGADPFTKHGTSTFYYNKQAHELADILKNSITQELSTKDDGVYECSYVLTRPTMPLSILIEIAYMIHPEEYQLLLDETFREKAANAIKTGLEHYLLNSIKTFEKNNSVTIDTDTPQ